MTASTPSVPSSASVGGVLRRCGWILRRRLHAGALLFVLSRASERRDICEIAPADAPGGARSLTPSVRLKVKLLNGVRLRITEREGLSDLLAALGSFLEARRGTRAGGAAGTALAESHEGNDGADLLLRTTFACNQRCAFCFVPLTGRGADLSEIKRELDAQARRSGPRGELTISGGEPASDPRLPSIIAAARRRGFRRFVLQTNGVYLARPGLLETLVGLGVRTYLVSFHSRVPAVYDKITGSRGQFPRAAAGLAKLLNAADCDVTVNVVVNVENYRDLPAWVGSLARLRSPRSRGRRPSVYFSMINEAGHQLAPSWAADLEKIAPYLRRAVARCRRLGFSVARSAGESSFPVCLLDDRSRHASQRALPQERVRYAEDFSGEAGGVGRAKRPSCRSCPYDAKCQGVPAAYARLFGVGSLGVSRRARTRGPLPAAAPAA